MLQRTLSLVFIFCFSAGSIFAQPSHEHTPWCGNHIFDPKNPKELSNFAKLQKEKNKVKSNLKLKAAVSVDESEPNDTFGSGDFVDLSQNSAVISGTRTLPFSLPNPTTITSSENNDFIQAATPLNLQEGSSNGVHVPNVFIGDGQFGQTSGDFDFYSFNGVIGEMYLFDLTSHGFLDPIVGIYNSNGNLIRIEDDEIPGAKPDPFLRWTPEVSGTYYLCIAGFSNQILGNNFPQNPFQSGTGNGAGFIGGYDLTAYRLLPFITANEPNGILNQAIPIISQPNTSTEFFIFGRIDNTIFSGDFDMFAFQAGAGQTFVFEAITSDPFSSTTLDPALGVYDSFGNIIAAKSDDTTGQQNDPNVGDGDVTLFFTPETAGTYFLVIGGQSTIEGMSPNLNFPQNPFDGFGSGITSTGFYNILVTTKNEDPDFLTFDLDQGDLFSARILGDITGFGAIRPNGSALAYTNLDVNSFSAPGSPFPTGVASLSFIAPESGRYGIEVFSVGSLLRNTPWQVDMLISPPNLTQQPIGTRQIVFVDFDGATVDAGVLTGPDEMRTLSPLSSFLPLWGIPANQESLLIDRILEVMTENLITDVATKGANGNFDSSGNNGEFALTLLNSRDHADPFGQPFVSRLVIGGTIEELGVETIGIAQSIDPGNFQTEETAVVLLDLMSLPPPTEPDTPSDSLLQYPLANGTSVIDVVATGIGNIASHEIGHYTGNWHTVNSNEFPNTMDQGGFLDVTIGVGPDNIFGSLDDIDVDFIEDTYTPSEVYLIGRENTLQAMSFGLSTGTIEVPQDQSNLWMAF